MAGFAALLVGLGIVVVIYGLIQRAKVGRVSAPVFPTGQLAQGGAAAAGPNGTASAEGVVVCQQALLSPVTGKPCLYYSLKITNSWKDGEKTKEKILREEKVAAQFAVHPTLIHDWKKKLLAGAAAVFEGGGKAAPAADGQQAELFEQIGRLKMELEWVKKKAATFG